jgi:hypothetical protein
MEWLWKIIHRFDEVNTQTSNIDLNESTMDYDSYGDSLNNNSKSEINKKLKKELKDFFKNLMSYMEKHDLKEDPFMKNLADDIYISIKTMNTTFEHMYNANRQRSQGAQYNYTCNSYMPNMSQQINDIGYSQIDDFDNNTINMFYTPRKCSRTSQASTVVNTYYNNFLENDDSNVTPSLFIEDNIMFNHEYDSEGEHDNLMSNYNLSQNITSPYINRSAIRVMKDISQIDDLDT